MTKTKKIISFIAGLILSILISMCVLNFASQNAMADEGDQQSNDIDYEYQDNKLKIDGDQFSISRLFESDIKTAIKKVEEAGATKDDVKEIEIARVNYVKANSLCNFANLEKISIKRCEATKTHIESDAIVNNPKLKYINIDDCKLDSEGEAKCIHNNPSLIEVNISCKNSDTFSWDWIDLYTEEYVSKGIEGNRLNGKETCKVIFKYYWSTRLPGRGLPIWIDHDYEKDFEFHTLMRYSNEEETYQWILAKEERHDSEPRSYANKSNLNNECYEHVDYWFNRAGNGVMEIEGANVLPTTLTEDNLKNGMDVELKNHKATRDAIKKLIIWQVNKFESDVLSGFSNLEEIVIKRCKSSMTKFGENVISNNPKLKKIYIEDFDKSDIYYENKVSISNCPELKEVTFDYENHLKDCKKFADNYGLKKLIAPSCEDPAKRQPVKVNFKVHGDDNYNHIFDWEPCYDKILKKDLWFWFDRGTSPEPGYSNLIRTKRTKAHHKELESTNCKNVFLVDTQYGLNDVPSVGTGNIIDGFEYHVRGYIAAGASKSSVQFFLNLNTKKLLVKCFGNADKMAAKDFDTAKQDWDFITPMSFTNGQTVKLSDYIQKIELDGYLRNITQFTFANLNKLEEVSIIANDLQNAIDLKTNSFAYCGLDNQKFDSKEPNTHIVNFYLGKWWSIIGFNYESCNGGAKPVIVD